MISNRNHAILYKFEWGPKTVQIISSPYMYSLQGLRGMRSYSSNVGHMTNTAARLINGKTLKNLLQNQLADDLETWYVASCMRVLPRLFKLSPCVDLDPFYAKVKFGHFGFCMGKSENNLFLETVKAFSLKVG